MGATKMSYVYLASPYSHEDHYVMEKRYQQVLKKTAELMNEGEHIYSPIVHCHEVARQYDLPRDFGFWQHYNRSMLLSAVEMYVLCIEGWKESVGVQEEIKFAESLGIIVHLLEVE